MVIGEIDRVDELIECIYLGRVDTNSPALSRLTLGQLAYVVAVDSHRHFGQAAAACNVTQPTLSMQIAKLERALGVTLFDRSRTPVVPTEVGAAIALQARVALREAARVAEIGDSASGLIAGELRLGVIPTVAPYLLPSVLQEVALRHPMLELAIEERVTDDLLDGLRRDTLDAGIIASPAGGGDLLETPLFSEPFVAYVSAGHRLAGQREIGTDDLSLDDLWLLSEGHCFRTHAVQLCGERSVRRVRPPRTDAGVCPTGARFESGNLETLKRLVERGSGMTLLPALAAAELASPAQRRLLRPFAAPAPSRDVRLVQRRVRHRQPKVEVVIAALLHVLPAELRPAESRLAE